MPKIRISKDIFGTRFFQGSNIRSKLSSFMAFCRPLGILLYIYPRLLSMLCQYKSFFLFQIHPATLSTATGSTASLATKLPAPGTGPVGTAPPPSSSALVVFSTTKKLIRAIGHRMWADVRNTVRFTLIISFGPF